MLKKTDLSNLAPYSKEGCTSTNFGGGLGKFRVPLKGTLHAPTTQQLITIPFWQQRKIPVQTTSSRECELKNTFLSSFKKHWGRWMIFMRKKSDFSSKITNNLNTLNTNKLTAFAAGNADVALKRFQHKWLLMRTFRIWRDSCLLIVRSGFLRTTSQLTTDNIDFRFQFCGSNLPANSNCPTYRWGYAA